MLWRRKKKATNKTSELIRDLAAAGAYVAAKEVAANNLPDAMLAAYVVGRMLEIDREQDKRKDPSMSEGYYTTSSVLYPAELERKQWRNLRGRARLGEVVPGHVVLSSILVRSYIKRVPGHVGSDGEKREWCIFQHDTHKLLQCYKTKEEAEKALKRMQYYKHKKSTILHDPAGNILGVFPSEDEAKSWLFLYKNVLSSFRAFLSNRNNPDRTVKLGRALSELVDALEIGSANPTHVSYQLSELTELVQGVLDWSATEKIRVRIEGTIAFRELRPEAQRVVDAYMEEFSRQPGMDFYPVYSDSNLHVYSFEVESTTPTERSTVTQNAVETLLNVLPVELPDLFSAIITVHDKTGAPAYEVYLPNRAIQIVNPQIAQEGQI